MTSRCRVIGAGLSVVAGAGSVVVGSVAGGSVGGGSVGCGPAAAGSLVAGDESPGPDVSVGSAEPSPVQATVAVSAVARSQLRPRRIGPSWPVDGLPNAEFRIDHESRGSNR